MPTLPEISLTFLGDLRENNEREWFNARKDQYETARQGVMDFVDSLILEMNRQDVLETESGKKALYRIYRDIRFSKDKRPYKEHWAVSLKRAGEERRGSYWLKISPGDTGAGGGFYGPNSDDLWRIREEFARDDEPMRALMGHPDFKSSFGEILGEKVKTAPKGFKKDHPAIDLIRYKQFYVFRPFSDEEAQAEDFLEKVVETYQHIRPFFDYMTRILTTNLDGESLLDR